MAEYNLSRIAILGGTGKEGGGLALRWAQKGYEIIIGSRQLEKAETSAKKLNDLLGSDTIIGMKNNIATIVPCARSVLTLVKFCC